MGRTNGRTRRKRINRKANNVIKCFIALCAIVAGIVSQYPKYSSVINGYFESVKDETQTADSVAVSSDSDFPEFSGQSYIVINDNEPDFTEVSENTYFATSELDELGRCGEAKACVGTDTLATEERGSIGMIKPSGWHTVRYDDYISDKYLYNRGHLIMFALYGNDTNVKENLITETRYANSETQLEFEMQILNYIKETGNKVEYHVKPIFEGNELVARGIELQALSQDKQLKIHVYVYNVQPNIEIDYATGDSMVNETVQVD